MAAARAGGAVVALVLVGCVAGPRALSTQRLHELATRTWEAPYDEVYDATWLSLEREGYRVTSSDAEAGLLRAAAGGRGYSVEVSQRGDRQAVTLLPTPERGLWQLDGPEGEAARWDALEAHTRELLAAWRVHPEWSFEPKRNTLSTLAVHLTVPPRWERVDVAVSRRRVVVQRHRPPRREGLNPTLVVDVERRRPGLAFGEHVVDAAELALTARGRLSLAEAIEGESTARGLEGDAQLRDGPVLRFAHWHAWDARTPEWTVRVVAICGPPPTPEGCEGAWATFTAGLQVTGSSSGR